MADRTGGLADVGRSASAVAIAITGAAVIAAPAIGRLVGRLDQERRLRVREEERAALAAHLHDSVLQSLVLIQRADDPRQMTSLARRQERELRSWLYGGRTEAEPTTLQGAVEAMTAAIELDHAIRVDAVTVGDQSLDDAATAMLGVLREATTNAARHAQVEHVDVYVEVDDRSLVGYVRDTGVGFDPEAVAADRRGIAESILGRAERAGGKATVASSPGSGTEVEIRIPRVKP
jgi:signal transduction histidine kinase